MNEAEREVTQQQQEGQAPMDVVPDDTSDEQQCVREEEEDEDREKMVQAMEEQLEQ